MSKFCPRCSGTGMAYWREGQQDCPACDGTGKTKDERLREAASRLAEALRNLLAQVPDSGHPHDALRAEIDDARAALREAGVDDA